MFTFRRARSHLIVAAAFAATGLFAAAGPAQASIKPCEIHHCNPAGAGSASQAPAAIVQCLPDHCDFLVEYYSDATYTVRVGEFEGGPCGYIDWGQHTSFTKHFQRTC